MTNRAIVDITRGITIQPIVNPTFAAGIYHNSLLGLISLSSDGTNRITIADKNLGATQVYQLGQTLSESNCGKFYQRGNNYGFPFTGPQTFVGDLVDTRGYGEGNLYTSDEFVKSWEISESGVAPNTYNPWFRYENTQMRGNNQYSQGPCPSGFHIGVWYYEVEPILRNLGMSTKNAFVNYLKMPMAGYVDGPSGNKGEAGSVGAYWNIGASNYRNQTARGTVLAFDNSGVNYIEGFGVGNGASIRPIKNTVETPDSSWTTLWTNGTYGIYHNPSLELITITSSSGNVTIADKNLGATQVYNGGTLSETNCGKFYQNGNCYGFPFTGPTKFHNQGKVDITGYGPNNPYSSSTYIYSTGTRYSSSANDAADLRGGVTGTNDAKRGPCPQGYHIPSQQESNLLYTLMRGLGKANDNGYGEYLLIPNVGYYGPYGSYLFSGFQMRTGVCCMTGNLHQNLEMQYGPEYYILSSNTGSMITYNYSTSPIRPFKNEPVVPNSSRTKLY